MTEEKSPKTEVKKFQTSRIDPSVPWHEEHNLDAARKLGWRYSPVRRGYVDSDGESVADRFGQPL